MAQTLYPITPGPNAVADAQLATNNRAGITAKRVAYARYDFSVDGGAVGAITPATTSTIPAFAVITWVGINSTTAVTSGGSATLAVGTTAGSSATALLGATAKASLSVDAVLNGVPVPQTASTWVKMSAAGAINVTVATATITAGVVEVFVEYVLSNAA
jgi:hypothetical protein